VCTWYVVTWSPQFLRYDTIRYDSVYLTCSKKLTGSQLSLPYGTNKKLKCETKNKTMSIVGPVQSRCHEGSPVGKRILRWENLLKRYVLSLEWKSEGVMDNESGDDNRDEQTTEWGGKSRLTGEADGMNQGVDSRDRVMHIWMSNLWFSVRRW